MCFVVGPPSAPGLAKEGLERYSDMGLTVTKGSLVCQGEKAIPAPKPTIGLVPYLARTLHGDLFDPPGLCFPR